MIQRPFYLKQLVQLMNNDMVKVITGVRRSGKSILLELYRDYLKTQGVPADDIIYLNFEAFNLLSVKTEDQLFQLLQERLHHDAHLYILLDEIQMVDGWQRVVNGVRVSYDCDIVVTGSNAKMLSGELATLLSGRYVESGDSNLSIFLSRVSGS